MRILAVVGKGYYGHATVPEPMYLYFTQAPAQLGHEVLHFDHVQESTTFGPERATAALEAMIRRDEPDLVLYQHAPRAPEPIDTEMFAALKDRHCIVSWNSDDDWQGDLTLPRAPNFTYMATTYPQVYAAHRPSIPNLILSQWACLGTYADDRVRRDIPFSFAGQVYWARVRDCQKLQRRAGLQTWGKGSRMVRWRIPRVRGVGRVPFLRDAPIDFAAINDVWNRTRVSYTPLTSSKMASLSIKSRVFDMGLSGTVMLCERAPHLDDYYDPEVEFVPFTNLDDCVEQARRLLADEPRRARIAEAYRRRTDAEHLWTHRFRHLFRDVGL